MGARYHWIQKNENLNFLPIIDLFNEEIISFHVRKKTNTLNQPLNFGKKAIKVFSHPLIPPKVILIKVADSKPHYQILKDKNQLRELYQKKRQLPRQRCLRKNFFRPLKYDLLLLKYPAQSRPKFKCQSASLLQPFTILNGKSSTIPGSFNKFISYFTIQLLGEVMSPERLLFNIKFFT